MIKNERQLELKGRREQVIKMMVLGVMVVRMALFFEVIMKMTVTMVTLGDEDGCSGDENLGEEMVTLGDGDDHCAR